MFMSVPTAIIMTAKARTQTTGTIADLDTDILLPLSFFLMILIRVGTGRVRTDTILNLGWKVFMPLSVVNLMIVLILKMTGVY